MGGIVTVLCIPPQSSVWHVFYSHFSHRENMLIPISGSPKFSSQYDIRLKVQDLLFHHQVQLGMRILGSSSSGIGWAQVITIDASVQNGEQQKQNSSEIQWGTCFKPLYSRAKKHALINNLFLSLPYALDFKIYRSQ